MGWFNNQLDIGSNLSIGGSQSILRGAANCCKTVVRWSGGPSSQWLLISTNARCAGLPFVLVVRDFRFYQPGICWVIWLMLESLKFIIMEVYNHGDEFSFWDTLFSQGMLLVSGSSSKVPWSTMTSISSGPNGTLQGLDEFGSVCWNKTGVIQWWLLGTSIRWSPYSRTAPLSWSYVDRGIWRM